MDTYRTVLYLHVLSLLLGIGAATVVGVCLFRLRSAQTLADALPWGMLAGKTERVFPVAILGLFSTGAYMTSDVWTWSTRWIVVSIVALALVALQGPLVAGLRAKALERALGENGPGPLGDSARRLARDPVLWVVTFANPGIVLGILWNMINKPSTAEAIAAVVVGYAAGAAVALPFTRRQAIDAQAVTDPTA
jgi:hypothetical protein